LRNTAPRSFAKNRTADYTMKKFNRTALICKSVSSAFIRGEITFCATAPRHQTEADLPLYEEGMTDGICSLVWAFRAGGKWQSL